MHFVGATGIEPVTLPLEAGCLEPTGYYGLLNPQSTSILFRLFHALIRRSRLRACCMDSNISQ